MPFLQTRAAMRVLAAVVSTLVLLVGCSPSPGPDGGGGGAGGGSGGGGGSALAAACAADAQASCAAYDRCERGGSAQLYGSAAACVDRLTSLCLVAMGAAGNQRTLANLQACTAARAGESCADLLDDNPPSACRPVAGTRPAGASCLFAAQCQSGWCLLPRLPCGTCGDLPGVGADCSRTPCGYGEQCVSHIEDGGVALRCAALVTAAGRPCDRYHPCGAGLSCVGASTFPDAGVRAEGTCQASGIVAGAACDSRLRTDAGCSAQAGLFCASSSELCTPVTPVPVGAPCGSLDGGTQRGVCDLGAVCLGAPTVCTAPVALGQACDSSLGPTCQRPLRCVGDGGTAGTCVAEDPSVCN